jgi:ABC-2 type transport system ATP-binding protein
VAVAALARSGVGVAQFSLGQPSLDEVFMALTGRPAEDQTHEQALAAEEERAA